MTKEWAIITGAANGIGHALALNLGQTTNLHILAVDKEEDPLSDLCSSHPDRFTPVHTDLSQLSSVEDICAAIPKEAIIKCLVHNAAHVAIDLFPDVTPSLLDSTMPVNYITPYFLTQKLFPRLNADKSRLLLVGASTAERPQLGMSVYGLSKASNLHMYKTFKVEFATSDVRTAYVIPGGVDTRAFRHDARDARKLGLPLAALLDKVVERGLIAPKTVGEFYTFLLLNTNDKEYEAKEWNILDEVHWARWRKDVTIPPSSRQSLL